MRPASIIWFERLYLGSLAVRLADWAVWLVTASEAELAMDGDLWLRDLAMDAAITLLLWFFIARRASNIARWILTVLFVFSPIYIYRVFADGFDIFDGVAMILWLLEVAAIWMLFRRDAASWLKGRDAGQAVAPAD